MSYLTLKTDTLEKNKVNCTDCSGGRFGNIFIRSFVAEYVNFEEKVYNSNPYISKYNNNNDLFINIHIRDIIKFKFDIDYN